jgi:hypothetical protein
MKAGVNPDNRVVKTASWSGMAAMRCTGMSIESDNSSHTHRQL